MTSAERAQRAIDTVTVKYLVTVVTEGDMCALDLFDMQDILSEVDRHDPATGPIIGLTVQEVTG